MSAATGAVTRRTVLKAGAAGAGLVLAIHLTGCQKPGAASGERKLIATNAWLRIGTDNSITFLCDRSEMGQGVYTALPTILAEELGVDPRRIAIEFAPVGDAYKNGAIGAQVTGGSTSVRDAWQKLRVAGAQAREMLKSAAAREWDTTASACRVENGEIISPYGKRLSYGAVAEAAAALPVPKDIGLKEAKSFQWIGKALTRFDTPAKVDGSAIFGIDVKLPGMLYAALAQPPMLGGKAKTIDDAAAKAMPGVRQVVATGSGVAVVADSWWQARKARDALKIEWDGAATTALNDGAILRGLRLSSEKSAGLVARKEGDADAALKAATRVVRAEYQLPLLAHATMEPQVCTADVRADGCDIYVPTQSQAAAQAAAATAAGLKPEQVDVHTTFLGGGFGRRIDVDFIPAAVEASKAVGKPVKLLWTREDDITHDKYRPPAYDTVAAGFDRDGKLVAWKLHLTGPSITARVFPGAVPAGAVDPFAVEAAANYPYDVPNILVDWVPHEIGLDVGYWRSVSHALNCFVAESFMDELALAARQEPAEFRRALLAKQTRHLEVLEVALRRSGYDKPAEGRSRGVAVMEGYGTYMAQVAEISIEGGKVKVHKIVCALDCGQTVNPGIVTAQVESSIVFGLSAALWGEINVQGGRVQQSNFHDYRLVRMGEMPVIETHRIESDAAPGGIGEPATALVAPAVCNAIYAATKQRLRSLPIARHNLA